jgi:hypothetical protein
MISIVIVVVIPGCDCSSMPVLRSSKAAEEEEDDKEEDIRVRGGGTANGPLLKSPHNTIADDSDDSDDDSDDALFCCWEKALRAESAA